jgi:hypothetical protein
MKQRESMYKVEVEKENERESIEEKESMTNRCGRYTKENDKKWETQRDAREWDREKSERKRKRKRKRKWTRDARERKV